jgi:hypothetical protein
VEYRKGFQRRGYTTVVKRVLPILGMAFFVEFGLYAQQTNVGNITGTVLDTSGAVVPSAKVVATNQGTTLTQTAVTDAIGIYTIKLLPLGNYTVTVTQAGFQKSVKTDIPVVAGEP